MSVIKKLAGQTAIYGLSSMVARFITFGFTPFYLLVFETDQYGIITEMYAYVAFLIILLTYGMETAFFRYSTEEEHNKQSVYTSVLCSLSFTSAFFIGLAIIFKQGIADWLDYPDHSEYIVWFAIIVALDALSSIPLARLRMQSRPLKFALVNIINVVVNIGLNVFFLFYCKPLYESGESNWLINALYSPEIQVGYVFISNLIASTVKFLILVPDMSFRGGFDSDLLRKMLNYAYPMLFVGMAGMINEMLDRAMLKDILHETYLANGTASTKAEAISMARSELGIYGANYKVTMIITLFIQAFRFAAEPFFFTQEKKKDSKQLYAKVLNYFLIVTLFMGLAIYFYLEIIIKNFTPSEAYWEGAAVVPILLLANNFLRYLLQPVHLVQTFTQN